MKARFVQQGDTVDYIPAAAVKAGDIVIVNDLVGVSRYDTAPGEKGALAVSRAPVFEIEKGNDLAFAFGANVFWDGANKKAANAAGPGILRLGQCVADSLGSDPCVRVRLVSA